MKKVFLFMISILFFLNNTFGQVPINSNQPFTESCELYSTSLGIADGFSCVNELANGNLSVTVDEDGIFYEKIISPSGEIISSTEIPTNQSSYSIENNAIIEQDENGDIVSNILLETAIINQFSLGDNGFGTVTKSINNTFWVAAFERNLSNTNTGVDEVFILKIDHNGNLISQTYIGDFSFKLDLPKYYQIISTPDGGARLFLQHWTFSSGLLFEITLNPDSSVTTSLMATSSTSSITLLTPSPRLILTKLPCNDHRYRFRIISSFGNAVTSSFDIRDKSYEVEYMESGIKTHYETYNKSAGVQGSSYDLFTASFYAEDGSRIFVNKELQTVPAVITDIFFIQKIDMDDNIIWEIYPDNEILPVFALDAMNGGVVQISKAGNNYTISTINCNSPQSCPDAISGFTLLGEFEGSKYFISNEDSQPADAQLVAQQNNGYLAVINSQEENNFLQQNISEMTYIGLNDVDSEGNLVWENGDPLNYNNINPCSFCNENSADQDYVIMAPWDGAWSFSSLWNSRKYIVEVPCNGSPGVFEMTYDCPAEFPQSGIWEVPVTLTNNTANPSFPFFLSLYLKGNGTGPNPQSTFATVTAPGLNVGESTTIILEVDLPNIKNYLPNRKTFPPHYIGEFTFGDFYISRSATVPVPTLPFDFYCKKYTTDLEVAIQNPIPNFTSDNEIVYTVAVTNNGDEDAYNIQTQLLKSIATSYTSGIPPDMIVDYSAEVLNLTGGSWQRLSGGNYVWYLPELGVGETATVDVIYHLDDPLEFGANLPDDFTVNVSTTSGHLMDTNNSNNASTFVFEKENTGGGDCPDIISGFTLLGEFEGSKYFISNENSQPADGQLVAQQNNGYLAVINSQEENDFLQQNISEMTYIGLNDVNMEGNLVWENGDPLNYNNINPCSFCNENSADQDYVIMAPWDGAWSFSSLWNSRKYIVEIPCNSNPIPTDFCGFLNDFPISPVLTYKNHFLEETSNGLTLGINSKGDNQTNNNYFFKEILINSNGQEESFTNLTLPVNNKSKFGYFGYDVEEISPTQFKISSVNSNGSINWENILTLNTNDNNIDELITIEIKEINNHLIVAGSYHFGGSTTSTWRPFLIKTDLNGNELWQNLLDVVDGFPNFFVHGKSASGGYYLNYDDLSDHINYLIKTDEIGNPLWTKEITIVAIVEHVIFGGESPDGSGLIIGVHSFDTNNAEVVKLNTTTGIEIWQRNLPSLGNPSGGVVPKGINGLIATADGGVAFMANFLDFSQGHFIYNYGRLDSDGNQMWLFHIPDELRDHAATLETSDGGFIFSKYNENNHSVDLFKVNENGLFDPICDVDIFSDLSLANLDGWNGSINVGDQVTIKFDIHNNALADANDYVVNAYLSTDNLLSANDVFVTSFNYLNTPFGVHEVEEAFQIPFVPEADYRLILEVDGFYTIAETNEDNNILNYSFTRHILGGPLLELPDLRPGLLSVGGNFGLETPPGDYTYTFDLSNIGNIPSEGGIAKVYLSEDTNWSPDDILIGEKLIGNVPVGSSTLADEPINVSITTDIDEALYRVILVIDANDEILEFDELNNESTSGITVISNANCPDDLAGFDFIGEFENAKYFLSHDAMQPVAAQNIAADNGGYLATIKSFAENEFIFSQIDEMVYIGLNDVDSEGIFEWYNNEPVSYVNFDICSFCNQNSDEMDFVVMHNWNGKWSWSNIWNSRKYIVEIPCGSTLTNPNANNSLVAQVSNELSFEKLMIEELHPNPAMDFIFATIQSPIDQEVELQIFDARGSLIKNVTIYLQKGKNVNQISISELSGGFYSIFIPSAQEKNATKRFVKIQD